MRTINRIKKNDLLTENNKLRIRNLTPADRAGYLNLLREISSISRIYSTQRYDDLIWTETVFSDTEVTLVIEGKTDNAFMGECTVGCDLPDVLEIGIDIRPRYQNKGIGTEALCLLIGELQKLFPDRKLIAKVFSNNSRGLYLAGKIGAVKTGEETLNYVEAMTVPISEYETRPLADTPAPATKPEMHLEVFEIHA